MILVRRNSHLKLFQKSIIYAEEVFNSAREKVENMIPRGIRAFLIIENNIKPWLMAKRKRRGWLLNLKYLNYYFANM